MAKSFQLEHPKSAGHYQLFESADDVVQIAGQEKTWSWRKKCLRTTDQASSWLLLSLEGGKRFLLDVTQKDDELIVTTAGTVVTLKLVDARKKMTQLGGGQPSSQENQSISSPMPGRLVKILVKVGDKVQAGQGVVVVEAMKMENELRAISAGIISSVLGSEGRSVEAGQTLVTIE